ncbi:ubiquitin binding protein [Microthyrium microscopicum]|uniref:Vacuolar protein sorting-associated protein 27 n=1 Tax=Microthyrium microscopicum TaxID=703497 RepID=A0A6A6UGE2_9PEZI|nr:ubiquitin binding protein [Microthyrium microscopicum]
MAGWFSSSNSALDGQIEQATADSLEDIALNLEISDVIRSKTVQPKEAMRSLKKRIGNKNPNIQLAALHLTDTCVKNGGSHFMTEIASREFMDNLTSLLKAYGPAAINEDVKGLILELIQAWADAAQGRPQLNYLQEVYQSLQREGFHFPPKQAVASSMFDTNAPPEWIDSDVCMRCRTAFTFTNRKHHCRNCGGVFCGSCTTKTMPLSHLGIQQAVRVDDGCYQKLIDKNRGTPVPKSFDATRPPPKTLYQGMQPRDARVEDSFDADLKKALEMSLEEAKAPQGQGYVPQAQARQNKPLPNGNSFSKPLPQPQEEDEEDAELKAAIEASLRDMEEQKKQHSATLKTQAATANGSSKPLPKPDELTAAEAENINLFSTLVERLQHQPPGTILREPQIQELYENIGSFRVKLARTYGETMSKHDALLDLHSKLATVVRYYDRMLEDRLSKTYQQPAGGYGSPAHFGQASSNPYPNMPTAPSNLESYYTGSAAPSDSYARPQSTYAGYPPAQSPYPQQATPQQPWQRQPSETPYSPAAQPYAPQPYYEGAQPPQRTASFSSYPPQPTETPTMQYPQLQRQPSYPSQSTQSQQISSQPPQQPTPSSLSNDPSTAYYFPDRAQAEPQPSQQQVPQGTPAQPPQHLHQQPPNSQPTLPPQMHPQTAPVAPGAANPQATQAPAAYQTAPPQTYQTNPQQPPPAQPLQHWPQQHFTAAGYGPESFPTVPHAQPKVEEALIEL